VKWVNGNASILVNVSSFLNEHDLCTSGGLGGEKLLGIERHVEVVLIWVYQTFIMVPLRVCQMKKGHGLINFRVDHLRYHEVDTSSSSLVP
jgi:hypothetical protein